MVENNDNEIVRWVIDCLCIISSLIFFVGLGFIFGASFGQGLEALGGALLGVIVGGVIGFGLAMYAISGRWSHVLLFLTGTPILLAVLWFGYNEWIDRKASAEKRAVRQVKIDAQNRIYDEYEKTERMPSITFHSNDPDSLDVRNEKFVRILDSPNNDPIKQDLEDHLSKAILQVAVLYDGMGSPSLTFHCDMKNELNIPLHIDLLQDVDRIKRMGEITIVEYSLGSCKLNTLLKIDGVTKEVGDDEFAFSIKYVGQRDHGCVMGYRRAHSQYRGSHVTGDHVKYAEESYNRKHQLEDIHEDTMLMRRLVNLRADHYQDGVHQLPICSKGLY